MSVARRFAFVPLVTLLSFSACLLVASVALADENAHAAIALPGFDLSGAIGIAFTIAAALGLKDLVAAAFRAIAAKLRAQYRATPSTADDVVLEAGARLAELAAGAAQNGDLQAVKDFVMKALHLPQPGQPMGAPKR